MVFLLFNAMKFIFTVFLFGLGVEARLFFKPKILQELSPAETEGDKPCSMCKTEWFNQTLDHFQPTDERTWKQRFFSNDEFFDWTKKTAPVFLFVGGETPISIDRMSGFHWHDVAKQHAALMLQLEHRFYGESWPLADDSLKIENLKYLSSQQALEDISNFIKTFNNKHELPKDVKWVTWGGSYAGNLAAWSRVKYPKLIFAAVTSSAPVLSTVEFPEFFQVAYKAIEGHSKDCATTIKKAMDKTSSLMKSMKMKQLNKDYTLCKRLSKNSSKKDITNFYNNVVEMLTAIVQYNLETIIPQWSQIQLQICNVMMNESMGTAIQRLNHVVTNNKKVCIFYQYDDTIKYWQNTDINQSDSAGQRAWTYQTCTEFGNLQTTSKTPMFTNLVDTDFLIEQCTDTFGQDFNAESVNRAVNKTNARYGGLDVKSNRITWTQGSFDPWYLHGISKSDNEKSPAFLVKRTSHCQDQFNNRWDDLPKMMQARNSVEKYLSMWLSEE